jgi:hypothetical protein
VTSHTHTHTPHTHTHTRTTCIGTIMCSARHRRWRSCVPTSGRAA